jgi:hypothetical protein
MSDGATDYIKDQIQNGPRDSEGKLINPIDPNKTGLGKSCQVYEPELVNKLISDEANRIVDELRAEATKEQQKLQDEYTKELEDGASCIQTKLGDYANNKGSGNASSTQLDTWMKECGANPDLLNAQIGDEGKTQSFADIIKSSIEGINDSYNRGTMEGCQLFGKWPWQEGSCIREGISEGVYYLGEGLGHVAATLLTPISEKLAPIQSFFNGLPIETNIQNNYNDIQNGFSNGARAVINGIGTVVGAVINLAANIENLRLSVIQTGIGCITGQPCSLDQIGNNYNNNHQFLKDKLGWDTGDWKQNATIVATTAVVVAATVGTVLTFGALGPVAAGLAAFVVGNALAYGAGSIMNGGLLNPQEFLCGDKEANLTECAAYQAGQLATGAIITKAIGAVIPKPAKTVVSNVSKSIDDLKKGAGAVDDIKNKTGKPGTSNPADDIDPVTGKKRIPCYSKLDNPNQTPLDYAVAFLFGGIRAEAADCVYEPGQKGYPNADDLENITKPDNKSNHLVSGNLSESQIIKSTQNGPAKYFGKVNEVQALEKTALKNGIVINDGTVIYDAGYNIGASAGSKTQYIRVDISAGTYHGHPIPPSQYNAYLKKVN